MAYVSGSAGSLADLLAAIQSACTANGWALANSILSKGNCHTRLAIEGNDLQLLGGKDSSLGTPGPRLEWVGETDLPAALTYPLSYHIHVHSDPGEVYVFCNFAVTRWQWLAFGCSPAPGLPGTGAWYAASGGVSGYPFAGVCLTPDTAGQGYFNGGSSHLFAQTLNWSGASGANSHIHIGLDGNEWSYPSGFSDDVAGVVDAWGSNVPLTGRQPNAWNGETALLPISIYARRPEGKVSLVSQLGHSRYLRNDHLADGEVVVLGADRWKTYPVVQKNAVERDGGFAVTHSGTFGLAIRYDGP